jgi:superfamily I DNA/RNA helicase
MSASSYIDKLDEFQRPAAVHPLGHPALIVSGAGSGKTSTMTARVKWVIEEGIPERRVAAITFTNKAAAELRHRLGYGDNPLVGPRVSTIHSLSLGAIRMDPTGFGLNKRVTPIDTGDQNDLIKHLLQQHSKDPKFKELKSWDILDKVGYHRARGLGFSRDYTETIHKAALQIHSGMHALTPEEMVVWQEYEKAKTSTSVVDFDDMLHLVVRRGQEDGHWRSRLEKMFLTVLVDEAQDTNPVQWQFIEMLIHPDVKDLYAVGDLSQSIYGWNGAAPEILAGMVDNWRGHVPNLYKLENNYRSHEKIVKFANRIQQTMTGTVPLVMKHKRAAVEGFSGKLSLINGTTPRDIAQEIASTIAHDNRLKAASSFKFKDNAILVRSAAQVSDFEAALVSCRVPYVVRGGQSLFQTEEAKDLFSYLKLVANPNDLQAYSRAISIPKRGVGPAAVEKVKKIADTKFDGDMVQASVSYEHMSIQPFGRLIQEIAATEHPVDLIVKIIRETKYKLILADRYGKDPEKLETKVGNLDRIIEAVQLLVEDNPTATCSDIIFRITMNGKEESEKEDGVTVISTIHSAKGLEWPRVYVAGMIEGSIPSRFSRLPAEIEEERRLFYVAATRARDYLALCIPQVIMRGPNANRVAPSRFLQELGVVPS